MAVRLFSLIDEDWGAMSDGHHLTFGAPTHEGPSYQDVPPSVANDMIARFPSKCSKDPGQANKKLNIYNPSFNVEQFEGVEKMDTDELKVILKFLTAGKEVFKKGKKGELLNRVKLWMAGAQPQLDQKDHEKYKKEQKEKQENRGKKDPKTEDRGGVSEEHPLDGKNTEEEAEKILKAAEKKAEKKADKEKVKAE